MRTTPDARRDLRQRMIEQRNALDPPARMGAAQALRRHLETLPAFVGADRLAGYWACRGELPLNLALAGAALRGQAIHLPCITGPRQLHFAPWALGDDVEPNRYGIPEPVATTGRLDPADLDVVLVPLLAFDRHGHRIGYGGGFYDASFAFLRDVARPGRPLLIGIGYAFQQCEAIEPADWDVRLDVVATDEFIVNCN